MVQLAITIKLTVNLPLSLPTLSTNTSSFLWIQGRDHVVIQSHASSRGATSLSSGRSSPRQGTVHSNGSSRSGDAILTAARATLILITPPRPSFIALTRSVGRPYSPANSERRGESHIHYRIFSVTSV